MPFVFIAGVKMRSEMFPVSWLIQARLADVATVVDENITGVRVVKSFAAENDQLRLFTGLRAGAVGEHRAGRDPIAVRPADREPARGSGRRSCCSTAATS